MRSNLIKHEIQYLKKLKNGVNNFVQRDISKQRLNAEAAQKLCIYMDFLSLSINAQELERESPKLRVIQMKYLSDRVHSY